MAARLLVVLVNYNSGEHLGRCLSALRAALAGRAWSGVVLDNASTDRSASDTAAFAPEVELVALGANLGFSRAANLGAARGDADLVLFLNPDCRVQSGFLSPLVAELEAHPRASVVAPVVVNEDGSPQGNARGDPSMLTGLFGRTTLLSRMFPSARPTGRAVVRPSALPAGSAGAEVDWVAGSCMLVRRAAFEQVGGFDERYFLYWEDADLCRRLRGAGWTIRIRADAQVVHIGALSSRTAKALAIGAFHRSAYLYYRTHVAPSPLDPRRWAAALLLAARLGVKLIANRAPGT